MSYYTKTNERLKKYEDHIPDDCVFKAMDVYNNCLLMELNLTIAALTDELHETRKQINASMKRLDECIERGFRSMKK